MATPKALPDKIGSKEIYASTFRVLRNRASEDMNENAKRVRQLLFMARISHPEKTEDEVKQLELEGDLWNVISVGESMAGMDPNSAYYNVRYVEDLVD